MPVVANTLKTFKSACGSDIIIKKRNLRSKPKPIIIYEEDLYGETQPQEIIVKKNINGHHILDFNIKKKDEEEVVAVLDIKIFKESLTLIFLIVFFNLSFSCLAIKSEKVSCSLIQFS